MRYILQRFQMLSVHSDANKSVFFGLVTAVIRIKAFTYFSKFEEVFFFSSYNLQIMKEHPLQILRRPVNSTKDVLSDGL